MRMKNSSSSYTPTATIYKSDWHTEKLRDLVEQDPYESAVRVLSELKARGKAKASDAHLNAIAALVATGE
jgi:hypothetical protein